APPPSEPEVSDPSVPADGPTPPLLVSVPPALVPPAPSADPPPLVMIDVTVDPVAAVCESSTRVPQAARMSRQPPMAAAATGRRRRRRLLKPSPSLLADA